MKKCDYCGGRADTTDARQEGKVEYRFYSCWKCWKKSDKEYIAKAKDKYNKRVDLDLKI